MWCVAVHLLCTDLACDCMQLCSHMHHACACHNLNGLPRGMSLDLRHPFVPHHSTTPEIRCMHVMMRCGLPSVPQRYSLQRYSQDPCSCTSPHTLVYAALPPTAPITAIIATAPKPFLLTSAAPTTLKTHEHSTTSSTKT